MSDDTGFERQYFNREVERLQAFIRALEDETTLPIALIMAQKALGTAANKLEALLPEDKQRVWPIPTDDQPSIYDLLDWENEYGSCKATDGTCWVEPNGVCRHGYPSWLLELGLI